MLLKWMYSIIIVKKLVMVVGIIFDNLVGLVVGLDKNGDCIDVFV